jgi:hypothetical protein
MGKFLSNQQTAAALIAKFGGTVTLKRKVPGTFDPVTQVETGGTVQSITFLAVLLAPSRQTTYHAGTLEIQVAQEAYFALKGQTTQPSVGDVVTAGGTDYKVAWAETLDPASDGPIYTKAYLEA